MANPRYQFEAWTLDCGRCSLTSGNQDVALRPKSFDVLRFLIENAGRAVSRDEVLEAVWTGVVVTEESLTQCVSELRHALGNDGPRMIKTVPRRGYLFTSAVSRIEPDEQKARIDMVIDAAHSNLIMLPDMPSIAVMPFANLSVDPRQEFFGDALAADIISGLSRIKSLFVIARNSTQQFKGEAIDVRRVSRELNVKYILEGTIQISGDQLRLGVELIDGQSAHNLWTEQFNRRMQDFFDVQDELTRQVVARLEPELMRAEAAVTKLRQPDTLSAWQLYHKGLIHSSVNTAIEISQAKMYFEQVLNIDPYFPPALAALSRTHFQNTLFCFDASSSYQKALVCARLGADLDPNDSACRVALAFAYVGLRNFEMAIEEARAALELNPNSVEGHFGLANCHIHMGKPVDAIQHLERAIALSPRNPTLGRFYSKLAHAYLYNEAFTEAVKFARLAICAGPTSWINQAILCSALGHLGELEQSQEILDEWQSTTCNASISFANARIPTLHKPSLDILIHGLRKAGLPEITLPTRRPRKP